MDTSTELTAPQWSADPTTAIDNLAAPHDPGCREVLHTGARHLDGLLATHPLAAAIDRFLAHPVDFHDRAEAFAAAVTFTELGLIEHPPTRLAGLDRPVRRRQAAPAPVGLVRLVSQRTDLAAAQVAVLEAGASPGELILITVDNFHTDVEGRLWLELPGTSRIAARTVEITGWAIGLMQRLRAARPDGLLLYTGSSDDPKHQQCSILMSVGKTYEYAGLKDDRTVKPHSLRNTGARATSHDARSSCDREKADHEVRTLQARARRPRARAYVRKASP